MVLGSCTTTGLITLNIGTGHTNWGASLQDPQRKIVGRQPDLLPWVVAWGWDVALVAVFLVAFLEVGWRLLARCQYTYSSRPYCPFIPQMRDKIHNLLSVQKLCQILFEFPLCFGVPLLQLSKKTLLREKKWEFWTKKTVILEDKITRFDSDCWTITLTEMNFGVHFYTEKGLWTPFTYIGRTLWTDLLITSILMNNKSDQ